MAIKIVVSNKFGFKVSGSINNEDGKSEPFEFSLTATRMDQDGMDRTQADLVIAAAKHGNHKQITDLLCGPPDEPEKALVTNWSGVKDADNAQLAYSPALLRQLIHANPGLHLIIWRAYQSECGAKEKN